MPVECAISLDNPRTVPKHSWPSRSPGSTLRDSRDLQSTHASSRLLTVRLVAEDGCASPSLARRKVEAIVGAVSERGLGPAER
jgi:hypothetical protein